MANEKAIRIAAIVLLLGVVVVSYMQWGKGVDDTTAPAVQEFKTPEQIAQQTQGGNLPAGGGWKAGQEGPEGGEGASPGKGGTALPGGGGWVAGEVGPEGGEGMAPKGGGPPTPAGGGWAEGEEGPEGTEGKMPDGEPTSGMAVGLCWKKAKAGKKFSYLFSGTVATDGFPSEKGVGLRDYAVVASERPLSDWTAGSIVEVHGLVTGVDPEFSLSVTSDIPKLHLCAVWPATLDEFQGFRVAACLPKALKGGADSIAEHGDLKIKPGAMRQQLLVLGGQRFQTGTPREGLVKRQVMGSVEAAEVEAGAFMVSAGATPVLNEEESQENPRAVQMTDAKGNFSLSYLATPTEPLHLCAMALPRGTKMNKIKSIEGQGCTQVQVPAAGPGGVVTIKGATVKVNAEKMPLAPHEQDHLSLVGRCAEES